MAVALTAESGPTTGMWNVQIVTLVNFPTSVMTLQQKPQCGSLNVAMTREPSPLTVLMASLRGQLLDDELAEILQAFFRQVCLGGGVDDRAEAYKRARFVRGRLAPRISRYIVDVRFSEETQSLLER